MKKYTVNEINGLLNGRVSGNCTLAITGPETLERAGGQHITFIGSRRYARLWESSLACAAVVDERLELKPGEGRSLIRVADVDLAMAEILELYSSEPPVFEEDIHPSAVVHRSVAVGTGCRIGAGCYLGKDVVLGDGAVLYPNVTILDGTHIGGHTVIWPGAVVRERCKVGQHCTIHSNVSIGADGFGFRPSADGTGLVKIPQIGSVVIGDGVEIGANSTVDRGKFGPTIIGDGCKIDNLVQIAHNCVLGRCCILAGNSGLAGSVTLGDGVVIGGGASIMDHTVIHSGAKVGGGSGVMNDVPPGKTVLGYPATDSRKMMKQWIALKNLGDT
ncbi:MAG TPA: UDP-3-O-(3-hydroxymyristoyl)glucosamine N-acyltransferase [Pricia sp.]|nr:UDP-3-O-(3-hydroxymyristoyl)glucosamine N-acyltransferase [Pricia sp.]